MRQTCSRRGLAVGVVFAGAWVIGACGPTAPSSPDVWAVVDGREIRRDDVEKAYRRAVQPGNTPTSDDELVAVKLGIVDELITQEVLLGRATTLKLEVTDAEVDNAFAARKGNLDEAAFQEQLRTRQLSDADLKQALRRELLADKVIEREVTSKITVSDQAIADFYNANRQRFNVAEAQYRIAQIVVTPVREPQLANRMNDDATSPGAAQQKAAMLMERLKAGSDFAQLAMDYSEDAQTAPQGGDLGFVPASALSQVQPALRNAVLQAEPGQVNVVSAGGGHTLVLLVARETAGQRTLDTPGVKDNIRQALKERKEQLLRAAFIASARDEATIVNHLARMVVDAQGAPPGLAPVAAPAGGSN